MPITIKGPAEGTLVASFNGKALASTHRSKTKSTTALILLSIQGNPHCQGEHLELIIQQALTLHTEITLLIGDELQWHNLRKGPVNHEETLALKEEAILLGDHYLRDNLSYFLNAIETHFPDFNKTSFLRENAHKPISEQILALNDAVSDLGTPFKITRWRDWVNNRAHPFAEKQTEILAQFDVPGTELYQSLEASTNEYVRRKRKGITTDENVALVKTQSMGYIKEECAAIMWIGAALGINVIAYPGKLMDVFQLTKKTFLRDSDTTIDRSFCITVQNSEELVNQIEIRFRRKKQQPLADVDEPRSEEIRVEPTFDSSPTSVSYLIKHFESFSKSKQASKKPSSAKSIRQETPPPPTDKASFTNHRSGFFTDLFEKPMVALAESSNKPDVQHFITEMKGQIISFANGLASVDSKLLASALFEQGTSLLAQSSTPIINLNQS